MAVAVVVLLEMVDVRQEHGERAAEAPRPLYLVRESSHEMPAVVETGERVGDGQALQLPLPLALPQASHQVLEHLRQRDHVAASEHRDVDRQVAGSDLGGRASEACDGTHDEQSEPAGDQGAADQQGQDHER